MSFSITNNSANAVITSISTPSSTYGSFTIESGSFPLFSGDTVSGTNTEINDLNGSPYGTIQLFVQQGNAQIEIYVNGSLYSANDYSSGIASVQVPILKSTDTIGINIDEAPLPVPSSTPAVTTTPTPTPSGTPAVTPTPSSTPVPSYIFYGPVYYYAADGATNISAITGDLFVNGNLMSKSAALTGGATAGFTGGTSIPYYGTGSTYNITLSASIQGAYHFADDGVAGGTYDINYLTGFTYWKTTTNGGQTQVWFSGTSTFYSGTTALPYTETGNIIFNLTTGICTVQGPSDTAYFNILPN